MMGFKLKMYFEKYKDLPLPSREKFRYNFKKKHGEFQYLEELMLMIEKYQLKKYGETLSNCVTLRTKEECRKINRRANAREKRRLENVR